MHRIELPHIITYQTVTHVDVEIVARSLLANAELAKESVALLDRLCKGATFQVTSTRVNALTNSSPLKEYLVLALFVTYQEELESTVLPLLESLLRIDIPERNAAIVTVLTMLVAANVIEQTIQRIFPGKDTRALQAVLSQKIDVAADLLTLPREELDAIIKDRTDNPFPKRLVEAALGFFAPAMQDGGVVILGIGGHEISEDAVREVPTGLDFLADEDKRSYPLDDVVVDIHRSDRDSVDSGWRGIVKDVSDKKIRLQLSPMIDPEDLYGKKLIRADVVVIEEKQIDGRFYPAVVHVMTLREVAQ